LKPAIPANLHAKHYPTRGNPLLQKLPGHFYRKLGGVAHAYRLRETEGKESGKRT